MSEVDQLVINLKKQNYSIYTTIIGDNAYIWRPLSRFERETAYISAGGDELLYEDLICNYAVLYPKGIDFSEYHLAGVPSALAPQIIRETGFDSTDKFLSEMALCKQNMLSNYVAQLETIIITAFPHYTFERMREWNIEQICDMAARAEFAIQKIHGQSEFSILDLEPTDKQEGEPDEIGLSEDELLRQKERELVDAGYDPILVLGPFYEQRRQKPYLETPFIMGTEYDNEAMLDGVRELLRKRQTNYTKQV